MMWALRETFPLHYVVFKQTACHILHEANVEQIFSRAGLLANARLDPSYLALPPPTYRRLARLPRVSASTPGGVSRMYVDLGNRTQSSKLRTQWASLLGAHATLVLQPVGNITAK